MNFTTEQLTEYAFPTLTAAQLALLRPFGEERETRAGDVLFKAGGGPPALVLVLAGRVAIEDQSDGVERRLTTMGPGEFAGELGLLTGQTVYATCVACEDGRVLVVPAPQVHEVIATLPALSDVLVAAFAARRQVLMRAAGASLTLIAPESAPGLLPLAEFADRNRIPNRWLAPDDPTARSLLARVGASSTPAAVWVVVRGQKALADPSPLLLAKALGLDLAVSQAEPADLAIVGTGPAGLSAAVYGASEGLKTVAIDDVAIGGQAGASSRIENYLGFPTGIAGGDLAFKAEIQALKFGARITVPYQATRLSRDGDGFEIELNEMKTLRARSVVVATGARYRRLGLPEQDRFEGAGIYYAATELEARRCRNADVIVVGGGNSAGQAAMFLAETAKCVHLLYRGADLGHSMSQYLTRRLEHNPNVVIHTQCAVQALHGDEELAFVTVRYDQGEMARMAVGALFVMIGTDPCTGWLQGALELDEHGFIVTGLDVTRQETTPLLSPFQTSEPGVFAVGDVRSGSVKRVASAVGEGSVVIQAIHRYLALTRGPVG